MSRATHARFLARQAERRAAELAVVIGHCAVCGADVTRGRVRDGEAYPHGPGVHVCRGCDSDTL